MFYRHFSRVSFGRFSLLLGSVCNKISRIGHLRHNRREGMHFRTDSQVGALLEHRLYLSSVSHETKIVVARFLSILNNSSDFGCSVVDAEHVNNASNNHDARE